MKKLHQYKLQLVTTITCASGMFVPVEKGETPQAQGAKVRRYGAKFRASINTTTCNYNYNHPADQT